jgi:hypothetical protein
MAEGYLAAEGYSTNPRGRDLIVGNRVAVGAEREHVYVWVPRIGGPRGFTSLESSYLRRFEEATEAHPRAPKFFLVPTREGLSNDFRSGAKQWYGVSVVVPVQFFDTAFKWDESPATTNASKLRDEGRELTTGRIPQPYTNTSEEKSGVDLLGDLANVLLRRGGDTRPINFVTGPAGMGKSHLFKCLFARIYDEFITSKKALQPAPRPIPLLAEHMNDAVAPRVRAGLQACLQSEFERPLREEVFEWMLANGLAVYLLDGLDEIIGRDPDFEMDLLNFLTSPRAAGNARPTVLVCIRDSLFQSSDALRAFSEDYASLVSVYRLDPWGLETQELFARRALGVRAPEFVKLLRKRTDLASLAPTPYYCNLLTEDFAAGVVDENYTETRLLDHALERIIGREYQKGLDETVVPMASVLDFAEALAGADMERDYKGLLPTTIREYADLVVASDVPEERRLRLITQLTQIFLWTAGPAGTIHFAQEALEHYLVSRWLVRLLDRSSQILLAKLNLAPISPDSMIRRLVASALTDDGRQQLGALAQQARPFPVAFKNAIQILSGASAIRAILGAGSLENADLGGVRFESEDLTGVSFRNADLSSTEFIECNLQQAVFEGAVLNRTSFQKLGSEALLGANFGDLVRFVSIGVDGRLFESAGVAQRWIQRQTKRVEQVLEPCQAVLQMRYIFGKFVYLTGEPRTRELPLSAITRGKTFRADPEKMVAACVRAGYLTPADYRNRIGRPSGDEYDELVQFVTKLTISPGLRSVLGEVCSVPNCAHVPKVALSDD